MQRYKTILIAGPTASGKSSLALVLAQRFNGVIVNTDSMQVYSDLQLLTARPSAEDEAKAPHRLYGHIDAAETFSTGTWLRSVETLLQHWRAHFETVIFTGGTGLYFNVLTQGLSEIPPTPGPLRQMLRQDMAERGAEAMHDLLKTEDPETALLLQRGDGQRILRALEVLRHTGRPLRVWQNTKTNALVDLNDPSNKAIVLDPDRDFLANRIDQRFKQIVGAGALEEVKGLVSRGLDAEVPAMKAIGVCELGAYLAGKSSLNLAMERAVIATRQYAKRQRTWFRGQMGPQWARFQGHNDVITAL